MGGCVRACVRVCVHACAHVCVQVDVCDGGGHKVAAVLPGTHSALHTAWAVPPQTLGGLVCALHANCTHKHWHCAVAHAVPKLTCPSSREEGILPLGSHAARMRRAPQSPASTYVDGHGLVLGRVTARSSCHADYVSCESVLVSCVPLPLLPRSESDPDCHQSSSWHHAGGARS